MFVGTKIDFVRFSSKALSPTQGTPRSAGYNLYSAEHICITLRSAKLLRTDIRFKFPCGYFGKIEARSSFALRFTDIGGGVIDADYRGLVEVIFSTSLTKKSG